MKIEARRKLSKNIKLVRQKRGYTQERVAELTGLDYKYVQRIEGKNPPAIRIDTIEKFAKALKTTCSKLVAF